MRLRKLLAKGHSTLDTGERAGYEATWQRCDTPHFFQSPLFGMFYYVLTILLKLLCRSNFPCYQSWFWRVMVKCWNQVLWALTEANSNIGATKETRRLRTQALTHLFGFFKTSLLLIAKTNIEIPTLKPKTLMLLVFAACRRTCTANCSTPLFRGHQVRIFWHRQWFGQAVIFCRFDFHKSLFVSKSAVNELFCCKVSFRLAMVFLHKMQMNKRWESRQSDIVSAWTGCTAIWLLWDMPAYLFVCECVKARPLRISARHGQMMPDVLHLSTGPWFHARAMACNSYQ